MKKFLLILLLSSLAFAELPPLPPTGEFLITIDHTILPDSHVQNKTVLLFFKSENRSWFLNSFVPMNSQTKAYLDSGSWFITGEYDDPNTQGKDLYAETTITISGDSNPVLFYQPVGSVSIVVEDENGRPISKAKIKGSCVTQAYSFEELNGVVETGESGNALLKFVPEGSCVFTAEKDSQAKSKTIRIEQGGYLEEKIVLKSSESWSPLVIPGLILALMAGFLFFRFRKNKNVDKEKTVPTKIEKKKATESFATVFKTLNENEKRIMEYLRLNNKVKQSKLFQVLLIPKTTLIRTIDSLQRKGLLKATPLGNTRLVELEKWLK